MLRFSDKSYADSTLRNFVGLSLTGGEGRGHNEGTEHLTMARWEGHSRDGEAACPAESRDFRGSGAIQMDNAPTAV